MPAAVWVSSVGGLYCGTWRGSKGIPLSLITTLIPSGMRKQARSKLAFSSTSKACFITLVTASSKATSSSHSAVPSNPSVLAASQTISRAREREERSLGSVAFTSSRI